MFRLVAGVVICALFAGCAMSSPADLTPDLDPSLPGVDAGYDPRAVPGAGGGPTNPDSGSSSSSSGNTGPSDAGAKTVAPPPVDAAPPIAKPSAGEVLITEVMYATLTPEPASEWLELHSAATGVRALSGLTIKDGGGRTHVIGSGITIAPGAYVVLARNKAAAIAAKVPSSVIAYEYGAGLPDTAGILLANGATGAVSLLDGTTTLSSSPYGGWFSQAGGSSIQLKALVASTSTAKTGWCLSLNTWTSGSEKGTPGVAGDCP